MAFSKSHLYPKDDQITSAFAKALSHSARLVIIRKLVKDGPCRVGKLLLNHPISKATLSKHLKILRDAKLVKWRERFPFTIYKVDRKNLALAEGYLKSFFRDL
ncbi:MAG TPA: helix-turn-helix transcriptional regulator [Saprospiraceae bacterium]|nr:helix-turn-helix transcriptional regulator [Saprospiraceae bacterium]